METLLWIAFLFLVFMWFKLVYDLSEAERKHNEQFEEKMKQFDEQIKRLGGKTWEQEDQ